MTGLPRQPDRERRALTLVTFHVDRAAMLLDQLADRRQAEADTLRLGREQRLENLAELIRGDARAVVDDGKTHMRPGRFRTDRERALTLRLRLPLPIHHRLRRVVDQVDQHLAE